MLFHCSSFYHRCQNRSSDVEGWNGCGEVTIETLALKDDLTDAAWWKPEDPKRSCREILRVAESICPRHQARAHLGPGLYHGPSEKRLLDGLLMAFLSWQAPQPVSSHPNVRWQHSLNNTGQQNVHLSPGFWALLWQNLSDRTRPSVRPVPFLKASQLVSVQTGVTCEMWAPLSVDSTIHVSRRVI